MVFLSSIRLKINWILTPKLKAGNPLVSMYGQFKFNYLFPSWCRIVVKFWVKCWVSFLWLTMHISDGCKIWGSGHCVGVGSKSKKNVRFWGHSLVYRATKMLGQCISKELWSAVHYYLFGTNLYLNVHAHLVIYRLNTKTTNNVPNAGSLAQNNKNAVHKLRACWGYSPYRSAYFQIVTEEPQSWPISFVF